MGNELQVRKAPSEISLRAGNYFYKGSSARGPMNIRMTEGRPSSILASVCMVQKIRGTVVLYIYRKAPKTYSSKNQSQILRGKYHPAMRFSYTHLVIPRHLYCAVRASGKTASSCSETPRVMFKLDGLSIPAAHGRDPTNKS